MLLVCDVCCGSSAYIRNEARLKWIKMGVVNADNYADGGTSIHLAANVEGLLNCTTILAGKDPF